MSRIEYHPYRRYTWFAALQCCLAVCGFVVTGLAVPRFGTAAALPSVVSIYLSGSAAYFYSQSLTTVFVDERGILLLQGQNRRNRYYRWDEVPYRYIARTFKGHRFLLLSPTKLDAKQSRHYISNQKHAYNAQILVLYLDPSQPAAKQLETTLSASTNTLHEFG